MIAADLVMGVERRDGALNVAESSLWGVNMGITAGSVRNNGRRCRAGRLALGTAYGFFNFDRAASACSAARRDCGNCYGRTGGRIHFLRRRGIGATALVALVGSPTRRSLIGRQKTTADHPALIVDCRSALRRTGPRKSGIVPDSPHTAQRAIRHPAASRTFAEC